MNTVAVLPARADNLRATIGLMTEDDLSSMLDVTVDTLAHWRKNNQGPDFCKLGRAIFYRKDDILDWIKMSVIPTQRTKAA